MPLILYLLCSLCDFLGAAIAVNTTSFIFPVSIWCIKLSQSNILWFWVDLCFFAADDKLLWRVEIFTVHCIIYSLAHLFMSWLNFLVVCCAGIAFIIGSVSALSAVEAKHHQLMDLSATSYAYFQIQQWAAWQLHTSHQLVCRMLLIPTSLQNFSQINDHGATRRGRG